MNVLFLSQIVPYPPHGGVLQRGHNLLRELGKRARVHLLAFVHPDALPTPETLDESRMVLSQFCEKVEYFPLWVKRSPVSRVVALGLSSVSSQPFSVIAHRSMAFQHRVDGILSGSPVDLVHVDTIALAPFVAGQRSVPSALTHHNLESMLMARRAQVEPRSLARWFLARESRKLKAFEAMAAPTFDVNILMSSNDEAALADRVTGVRTCVVPNGVDTSYFTPAPEPVEPVLIYTGGMNMFANKDAVMHFLKNVWPQVVRAIPSARFIAVGQDPPRELHAHAARDPRITVTGYVDDIRPFVRQAAVYVVPLRVGGGTRLKVLDAMAMGKALVSTAVGCEGLLVNPGEHLVVADTDVSFAESTVALLRDWGRRTELGRAARQLVEERYSWSTIGDQLFDAYREAIALRRRAA